jgi:hypothetical protein
MADNTPFVASTDPASPKIADDEVSYSGDLAKVQIISLGSVSGVEGSKILTKHDLGALLGALTETAPVNDTASSGQNGRLQRIAQRLSSLLGVLPAALGQTTKANSLSVALASDQIPNAAALVDGAGNPTTPMIGASKQLWNGATWDRARGNQSLSLLTSAVRTVQTGALFTNHNARGAIFILSVTAAGSGTLQFYIQSVDANSVAFQLIVFPTISTTGIYLYIVYPGAVLAGAITGVLSAILPRSVQLYVVPSGATNWTYSLAAELII